MNETRNILLVGRTGQGKSSLANLLVNKNGRFEEIFKVGSGSISMTKNPQTETFREGNITYQIIDTPSFSDTELTSGNIQEEEKIFYKLAQIASEVKGGINQILFVSDGRFTEEEVKVMGGLRSVVFDEKMAGYLTIIRTRFPEFGEPKKCKEDYESLTREELINKNKAGSRLVRVIGERKFVHVDNPPIRGNENAKTLAMEIKKETRSKLLNHLVNARASYEPENLVKLKKRIKESTDSIEKEKQEVQRKIEDTQKELEKLREQRDLDETERSRRINERETQLRSLNTRSTKLEEEKISSTKSVASNLFNENIDMIIKTSEAGVRIGKDTIWGVGGTGGGILGFATGVGGALFNSGISLAEEGVNFLTGNKEDKLRQQVSSLLGTNSQLETQLRAERDRAKRAEDEAADLRRQRTDLISNHQTEKANLQSQINQLQGEKSTLAQQVQDKDNTINNQNQTIQNNQNEIDSLKQQVSDNQNEITRLNATIASLQKQLNDKTVSAQQNQDTINNLNNQIQTLQTQNQNLQQQIQTLQQTLGGGGGPQQGSAVIQQPPQGGNG